MDKGYYFAFEGGHGSGKSTQAELFFNHLRELYPNKEIVLTREPGGCVIAEKIREVVQGTKFEEKMNPICDAYLYASARAQSLRSVVKPVLDRNGIVVSDRCFVTSIAIQGYAQGLGYEKVLEVNKIAVENLWPDKIIYISLDIEKSIKRAFDAENDKFESEKIDFLKRMSQGYDEIAKQQEFIDRWVNIDGDGTIDEVFKRITDALGKSDLLPKNI